MITPVRSVARHRPGRSLMTRLLGLLAAGAVLAACSSAASLPEPSVGAAEGLPAEVPAYDAANPGAPSEGSKTDADRVSGSGTGGPGDSPAENVLIVRTGQLDLEVPILDDGLAAAGRAVAAAGGYVAASQRQGDGERASATVTYRIPADRWESTLTALREVGTKVLAEQTASEEVTSQVVDLGARLANLRATESALQGIMAKAVKIPDVLEVQAQLTEVRGEIEQLTAQKQSLEERAALATLSVSFTLPPVVAVTQVREGWDPGAEVDRAAATLVGIGQGLANGVIWAAIVLLPLGIVLAIIAGLVLAAMRRARPRGVPPVPPVVPPAVPPSSPTEAPAA